MSSSPVENYNQIETDYTDYATNTKREPCALNLNYYSNGVTYEHL